MRSIQKKLFLDRSFLVLFFVFSSVALVSCDLARNYTKADRDADMEIQDFRDGMAERLPEVDEEQSASSFDSIPALNPYISNGNQNLKSMPLVSVSVNQSVPLRDILYELAQQAEYDLELDPNIRGSIIFTARNKPFDVVVDRIAGIANLRYKFEEDFLRVEVDTPFIKTYKVDYLNLIRSNQGGVSTNVTVVSGDNSGADNSSTYQASTDSTSDFWGELELNLEQILGGASTGALKTRRDPRITAAEQNPDIAAVSPEQGGNGVNVQPPEAVLRVESLPVDGEADGAPGSDTEGPQATYSLNKQAGLINIMAPERVHKQVEEYLNKLRRAVTSQVLIEAKVFEVSLFDEFITGIEWAGVTESGEGFLGLLNVQSVPAVFNGAITGDGLVVPQGTVTSNSAFNAVWSGDDVAGFVEAISGFGTVRALASPRLTVLNNQSAALNVVTNRVFFEIEIEEEEDDDTGDITREIEAEIKSVPEGVLINVQPSINLEDRTISLHVKPTITSIVNRVSNIGVTLVDSTIDSPIPEVNVQEIDTVIKVNTGQAVVMGGLLQDRSETTQEAVPVLGELPLIGAAFRSQEDISSKTELVIFLKATLLDSPGDTVHNTDRDLYRTFSGDRRPFKL